MRNILVDTGAIVALLRPGDRHHPNAVNFFAALHPGDLLHTTWPVITECAFIMRHREELFWDWLFASGIEIANFALHDLQQMRKWRTAYIDREIDFADATLVWLATVLKTNLVATTDFADFETYRLPQRKSFKLLIKRG